MRDPIKSAIKQVIRNKQQAGADQYAVLVYLASLEVLWSHTPQVVAMIQVLKSDVTRVIRHRKAQI